MSPCPWTNRTDFSRNPDTSIIPILDALTTLVNNTGSIDRLVNNTGFICALVNNISGSFS